MVQLPARDLQAVLDAVNTLQADLPSEPWTSRLFRVLPALVPTDFTSYNEIDLSGGPSSSVIDRADFNQDLWPVLLEHMDEHPLAAPATDAIPVIAISDRTSRRGYERLGIYNEVYRPLKVDDQIVIRLPSPRPRLIAVALSRQGWGFSRRERSVLELLRPHLLNAHARSTAMHRLQQQANQWRTTIECLPHALIAVSREGNRLWQTDAAGPILDAYFPESSGRGAGSALPDRLKCWLRQQWSRFEESLAVVQPLLVSGEAGRLIVRPLCGPDGQRLLMLEEQSSRGASVAQLRRLNLTGREAEVLHSLMQGGTNPHIAVELGISPRTVQKHIERLFAKLGVQTRTAAATRARDMLGAAGV